MELDGCGQEGRGHLVVQHQGAAHQVGAVFLHGSREGAVRQVLTQDAVVDGAQRVLVGETHGEHTEVTLDGEKKSIELSSV